MKKMLKWLLEHADKLYHASLSFSITLACSLFIPLWIAALIGLAVGLGKELLDKYVLESEWDNWDFVADCVGIVAAELIMMLYIAIGG